MKSLRGAKCIDQKREKRGKETDTGEGIGPPNMTEDLGLRKEMASR